MTNKVWFKDFDFLVINPSNLVFTQAGASFGRTLAYSTEHCQTLGNSCECHGFLEITFQTDVPCHSWHDTLPPSWGLLLPMVVSPNERKILQRDKNKQNHSWFTRKIFVVNCTLYVMPFYFITLKQESF